MTTLPLFWNLSSASKTERIKASVKLISTLEHFQAQFAPQDTLETSREDEEDGKSGCTMDALNAQDVSYSIKRLVRGLASPRECSRLGFAVALTELLSRINTVTCSQIVSLIIDSAKTHKSMSRQEQRDVLFARLFGFTAVIQSGLLVRTQSSLSSVSASSLSSFQDLLTNLIALGEKKSWLKESAWWTITLMIDALNESAVSWKSEAVSVLIQITLVDNKDWSPEKVALTLKLQSLFPDRDWSNFLSPPFKNPDLLSRGNLNSLARILKESTREDDDLPQASSGAWKPQVHFVWDIILKMLLPDSATSKGSFQEFFRVVVDESLFSSSSSPERKYWGFQVFQMALPLVTANNLPMLFTKNFMRTWINHLSQHNRYLHKAARQVATDIRSVVEKNPTTGFALILQLTGVNGCRQFDTLTKTKTVESILTSMDTEGIKSYIDYLLKQVNEEGPEKLEVQAINSRRTWMIDQLWALIHNSAIPKSDDWVLDVLDWLAVNGLFVIKKKSEKSPFRALRSIPSPVFSDKLRQHCATRLLSCLADLTGLQTHIKSDGKPSVASGAASDGEFWISKVLATIRQLEKDDKHVTPISRVDPTLQENVQEIVEKLNEVRITSKQQDVAIGAELLLLATLLQQYCSHEQSEANTESLEACIDGASRICQTESEKDKAPPKSTSPPATDPPHPHVDVLVDVIIAYLERPTPYLRVVGNQAFSLLSGAVRESTIELILAQLERRNPTIVAEDEDERMDSQDDEEDAGEDGSENDKEETSSENQSEGDDINHESTDAELRKRLDEIIDANGADRTTGDTDSDSDREEEFMDDEQMLAADERLAAVFKAKSSEKRNADRNVDAQREATHFKNRVLGLVETFLKKQPSSPYTILFILPLVDLVAGTGPDERQLSDKAKSLLTTRMGKNKLSEVSTNQAVKILEDLHMRARKPHSSDILAILNQCSLHLVKILLPSALTDSILKIYRQSLADFITRKNSPLNTSFFQDFFRLHPSYVWHLGSDLLELSAKAANGYRRCQVFQLCHLLIVPSRTRGEQPELANFMLSLRQALYDFACDACNETVSLNTHQMKDLLKVGMLAIRQTQFSVTLPEDLPRIWTPEMWDELSLKLAASKRFKTSSSLFSMCKQMARMSQSPPPAATKEVDTSDTVIAKRKARELEGDEEEPTTTNKVKRKKKSKSKT